MIEQYQPAIRFVTRASALLLLALACFTFSSAAAAEKAPAKPGAKARGDADLAKQQEAYQRGLKILEEELAKQNQLIQLKQKELDEMRTRLGISELEAGTDSNTQPDVLRRLQSLSLEAKADYQRIETLLNHLLS